MQNKGILKYQSEVRANNDKTIKPITVGVMGMQGVGKTSIIRQLLYKNIANSCLVDHSQGNKSYRLKIDSVFLTFVESEDDDESDNQTNVISDIISANIFILVFAVDSLRSYEYVEHLKDLIIETKNCDTAIVVVGNKHDASTREIGFAFTDCVVSMDWELPYVETSVKTGYNIGLILPSLFRHCSLKMYRDLLNYRINSHGSAKSSRRMTTGSLDISPQEKCFLLTQNAPAAPMINKTTEKNDVSVQEISELSPASKSNSQRKKASYSRRRSLTRILTCSEIQDNGTPEFRLKSLGSISDENTKRSRPRRQQNESSEEFRLRSKSFTVERPVKRGRRDVSCTFNMTAQRQDSAIFTKRRSSDFGCRKENLCGIDKTLSRSPSLNVSSCTQTDASVKRTKGWLSAIRSHLKK